MVKNKVVPDIQIVQKIFIKVVDLSFQAEVDFNGVEVTFEILINRMEQSTVVIGTDRLVALNYLSTPT